MNVGIFEPEPGIDVRSDLVVGFDDVLYVCVDKVVERVDVLFDETFDLEESGQQEPFVLSDCLSRYALGSDVERAYLDVFNWICDTQPAPVCAVQMLPFLVLGHHLIIAGNKLVTA